MNVDLILNPSASHFAFAKSDFRYNLIIGSSERFKCTYLYANLLGNEAGRMIFDGEVLISRNGTLIQRNDRLSFKNFNLVYADIDFSTGKVSDAPLHPDDREKNFEFGKLSPSDFLIICAKAIAKDLCYLSAVALTVLPVQ